MYHLFDKIYLMYDMNIGVKPGGIIISPRKSIFTTNPKDMNYHYNVDSYEELVGLGKEFKDDLEFFTYLSKKIEVERSLNKIFCSEEEMIKIMIKYLKLFLPNLDADSAYFWYLCYFRKIKMHFAYTDTMTIWHKDFWQERIWYEYQNLEKFSQKRFNELFNELSFSGNEQEIIILRKKLMNRVEFTFNVIRYIHYKESHLSEKILYMYYRTLDHELNKIKQDIIHGVYGLDQLYPEIDCDFNKTPEEIIKQIPNFEFVLDERIGSSFMYWDHYKKYDIKKLIKTIKDYASRRSLDSHAVYNDMKIFDLMEHEFNANDILDFLQNNLYYSETVLTRDRSIKFNYYFLSFILQTRKRGDLNLLKKFDIN